MNTNPWVDGFFIMKTQQQINQGQSSVNDIQGRFFVCLGIVNNDQNTINEQTKIDLSVRNFWAIVIGIVGITSFYLYSQFSITSDIKEMRQDLAYIKEQNKLVLERYISLENRYGEVALKIQRLEVVSGLK